MYLIDANILITPKNSMPMDLYPTFWQRLSEALNTGKVFSCRKVKEEISNGNDELVSWCKEVLPSDFFIEEDEQIMAEYSWLMVWSQGSPIYFEPAKQEFAQVADAYLIATAAAKKMKIVTFETSEPNRRNKVKIPDACMAIGVEFCTLNDMLRDLQIVI